jgi:hypothetical protein
VDGANFTFEDARRSDASTREIQSDGGFGIYRSGSFNGDAPELASEDDTTPSVDLGSVASARPAFAFRDMRAQPVPLKCTAGAEMQFRMWPRHLGHSLGPCSWTECITSISWPQSSQT